MTFHSRVATLALTIGTVIAFIPSAAALAQNATAPASPSLIDSRWQPWLGCWTPVERAPRDRDIQVCIVPAVDGVSARMMTFVSDQRILDEAILADGSIQVLSEVDCRGSSRSVWAKNAARLFRTTELACEGKAPQRTVGISTLEGSDRWLDVQVVVVGDRDQVRTRHYARSSEIPPAEIANQVRGSASGASTVNSTVTTDDIIEANAIVSHRAVEVWLSDSSAQIQVNRRALLALHDASVPAPLIDLMVARAYPKRFEVKRSGSGSSGFFGSFSDDAAWASPFDLAFDPYAFYYSPFGSYRQFVDPGLYSVLGGYVTVPAPSGGAAQSSGDARVVNGSGYTRVEPRQPPVVVGRTSEGSAADSSGSAGSSSSSGGSSSGSGSSSASPAGYSGGGGGAQTAVPR